MFTLKDKKSIFREIIQSLEQNLSDLRNAAEQAHQGATHEDAVAKSKYETHGLELSYLAGTQYERARKLETDLAILKKFEIKPLEEDEEISIGSLVEISDGKKSTFVFISSQGAGSEVTYNGKKILVLSSTSPMGESLIGSSIYDEFEVQKEKFMTILSAI